MKKNKIAPAILLAFAALVMILPSPAHSTTGCQAGQSCKTTDECGQYDACSCRTGFDGRGICATCDLDAKRPTSNLECVYSGAVVPSNWNPANGERVTITVEQDPVQCCNDPFYAGCKDRPGFYRPVVLENRFGNVVGGNFFWENYKDFDCIGLSVPSSRFEITAYSSEAPYTIKQLTHQYVYHGDLDHYGFYDIENYDGYPSNYSLSCAVDRKDHCDEKYWESVGQLSSGKCEGYDACTGTGPLMKWKQYDAQQCTSMEFSCEYSCGSAVSKVEADHRYVPPACEDFSGCGLGTPYCRLGYCAAACEKDTDCGQSTCTEGSQTLQIAGICTNGCSCGFAGKYDCKGPTDACLQVSCNDKRFYCTQAKGAWGWRSSPDCSDADACTVSERCTKTDTVPGAGTCAGQQMQCGDKCGPKKIEIGGVCSAGTCNSILSYTCESALDSCKMTSCGGQDYYCTDFGHTGNYTWQPGASCDDGFACTFNTTCHGGDAFNPGTCGITRNGTGAFDNTFNYTCKDDCGLGDPTVLLTGQACDGRGGCVPGGVEVCNATKAYAVECKAASCSNKAYWCGNQDGRWEWSSSPSVGGDAYSEHWINKTNSCSKDASGVVESLSSARCQYDMDACKLATYNGRRYYCTNAQSAGDKTEWKWVAAPPADGPYSCDDGQLCSYDDACALGGIDSGSPGKCGGTAYACQDTCGPGGEISRRRVCTGKAPPGECAPTEAALECSSDKHTACQTAKCGGESINGSYYGNETDYYCTNLGGEWGWRNSKSCFDANYCTSEDACTATAAYSGDPSGKCEGKPVADLGYCRDSSGLTINDNSTEIYSPGLCCSAGLPPTSASCDKDGVEGGGVDPRCVKFACQSQGRIGYESLRGQVQCGKVECPPGTVGTGCTEYCTPSGKCDTCIPNCVLPASDELLLTCPRQNSFAKATIKATTYIGGTPTCAAEPALTATLLGANQNARKVTCSNGVHTFEVDTPEAGYYRIKAQVNKSFTYLFGECEFDNFPISGKAELNTDITFIISALIMGLPVGLVAVLFFMKATE